MELSNRLNLISDAPVSTQKGASSIFIRGRRASGIAVGGSATLPGNDGGASETQ
jgi:hypothetical protein